MATVKLPRQTAQSFRVRKDNYPDNMLSVSFSRLCNPSVNVELAKELESEIDNILASHGFTRYQINISGR